MQTIPKGRPVPVIRRTVNTHNPSHTNREMGQTVLPDNPRNVDDANRQSYMHNSAHIKAAIKTPEEERRRFHMSSSPSPNAYGGHFSPKPSPIVRPQSAMALTSPPGNINSNTYIHNYNNSYSKAMQHQRPPSSLGIRDVPRNQPDKQPTMHQHSRSFGDGITSEQVFTDRLPPRDVPNDAYQRRNQSMEQHKSPVPARVNHGGPRGSYNPYYASNLDLNSRSPTDHPHTDKPTHDNPHHAAGQDTGARTKISTPAASSQDLRSAWKRLYGQNAEPPVRRPSVDHLIQNNPTQRPGEADYQKSPRQGTRSPYPGAENNMQHSQVRMISRNKPVAGPMVTPFANSGRQSPPGQCSTHQNQPQGFNNSAHQPASFSSPKPAAKTFRQPHHEPHSHSLGPAAKYPDPDMGLRKTVVYDDTHQSHPPPHPPHPQHHHQSNNNVAFAKEHQIQQARKDFGGSRESGLHHQSPRYTRRNDAYCSDTEIDGDDEQDILPTDSIFDYVKSDESDEESTVAHAAGTTERRGSRHNINIEGPSFQRNVKSSNLVNLIETEKPGENRPVDLKTTNYARSRSLEDVRESGDDVSNVSFDIENTFLMVDPSDQSEMGTLRSKNSDVKTKLNRLEGMYAKVMKTLDTRSPKEPRGRRWSIGSSDTNSIRHQVHQHSKHGRSNTQRMSNREIKSVNKRFQRLESHVITLARSIAHISSELRTQTTMSREIENVKREIQDLKLTKNNTNTNTNNNGDKERKRHDFDKYRGYNHPLTNPKQVNKLTRFFGQEPSWLEIFLTRLGYEQYVKNFHQEHIGMMELPYMTDDQLKSIGIPMGPRTRILQESQMCFKDDNFNIYIV